jgi:hypothetical protein
MVEGREKDEHSKDAGFPYFFPAHCANSRRLRMNLVVNPLTDAVHDFIKWMPDKNFEAQP